MVGKKAASKHRCVEANQLLSGTCALGYHLPVVGWFKATNMEHCGFYMEDPPTPGAFYVKFYEKRVKSG